jgi:hypothetical protein
MSVPRANAGGPFSVTAVLAMIGIGIVAFAAFIVLIAFADDLRDPHDGQENALSRSAVGFAGLASLLSESGHTVRVGRGTIAEASSDGMFVILSPPMGAEITWEHIYPAFAENLIVLPKWQTRRNEDNPLWVDKVGPADTTQVAMTIDLLLDDIEVFRSPNRSPAALVDVDTGNALPIGPIDRLQTIKSENLDAMITDADGNIILAAMWSEDDDEIAAYVLSDPDLLNTHGLSSPLTARTAVGMIEKITYGSPVAFDLTLHGLSRSRNMLQLALTPPFLPAVLCLAFAGLLIAVVAFAGNPRASSARSIPFGKTTLVDNTAKLIAQTGRTQGVAQRYVAMIRRQAAQALGVPSTATEAQQSATLDALHRAERNPDALPYSELAQTVTKAPRSVAMLRAMKRMYKWKQELGRESNRR